jgi:cytochrome c556
MYGPATLFRDETAGRQEKTMREVSRIGVALALLCTGCGERRQDAELPSADAIRAEMRTMLGSLNGLLEAAARGDTVAMREAATRSGLANAADPALEKLLPEEFLTLGMGTHRQFDELAAALKRGLPADSVFSRLGGITASCVACHSAYRLTAR